MPIYEFLCTECNHPFERLILTKQDEKENICPKCKSKNVIRQMSRFGFGGNAASESSGSNSSGSTCSSCSGGDCSSCH